MTTLRRKIYHYLKKEDFACPCCGRNEMQDEFLYMLDNAMEISGFPYKINSGFRCPAHNATIIGSSPTSSHMKGCATDIEVLNNWYRFKIVFGLIYVGFERINLKSSRLFLHTDTDPDKSKEILWID